MYPFLLFCEKLLSCEENVVCIVLRSQESFSGDVPFWSVHRDLAGSYSNTIMKASLCMRIILIVNQISER